jgi:hypothetical protein
MEDGGYVADDEKSPKSGDEVMEDEVMGGEVIGEGGEVMVDGLELILLKALKI